MVGGISSTIQYFYCCNCSLVVLQGIKLGPELSIFTGKLFARRIVKRKVPKYEFIELMKNLKKRNT